MVTRYYHLSFRATLVSAANMSSGLKQATANNGLVQVFGTPGTGPIDAVAEVWVYVNSGIVGLGIGDGGSNRSQQYFSQTTGQWELLTANASTSPVNEIIIYSSGGSAEFYVDLAAASAVPETGSCRFAWFHLGSRGLLLPAGDVNT